MLVNRATVLNPSQFRVVVALGLRVVAAAATALTKVAFCTALSPRRIVKLCDC